MNKAMKWTGAAVGGLALLTVIGLARGGPEAPPAPAAPEPPSAEKIVSKAAAGIDFAGARADGDTLVIRYALGDALSEKSLVSELAGGIAAASELIRQGAVEAPEGVRHVRIEATAAGTDRLGQPVDIAMPALTFAAEDLRQLRAENLTRSRMVALATDVSGGDPAGVKALLTWCSDEKNYRAAESVCLKAASTALSKASRSG